MSRYAHPVERGVISALGLTLALAGHAETLFPGHTGDALLERLRADFSPQRTLSYRAAREKMFGEIDNQNGAVTLVYSGQRFPTTAIPDHRRVNTEHTWPQSKFKRAQRDRRAAMKSDVHHLFPTFSTINSARGSSPFADIPDPITSKWWVTSQPQTTRPRMAIDDYSESTPSRFEPREAHKGNVARAMAYFYMAYGDANIDVDWFKPQLDTLFTWHEHDPIDEAERARSEAIATAQGNENPFVLDPTLFARALMAVDADDPTVDDDDEQPDDVSRERVLELIDEIETRLDALKQLVGG